MRFRANVVDPAFFARIMQTVDKLQKRCIIKFMKSEIQIICMNDMNEGGVQIWSQIRSTSLFAEYRIQSNADNQITLTLSSEALLAVLRSASSPLAGVPGSDSEIVMKLAKKNDQAVLSFEILGTSRAGKTVRISHDVKIEVMRPPDVESLKEPMCPEPDVQILLPSLLKLRTVIERLKSHSDIIAFRANNSGKVQISASTEAVKIDVNWEGLNNPKMGARGLSQSQPSQDDDEPDEPRDPTRMYGVLVSIKSFLKFLNSHVVSTTTIACLCQNHCLILYVYIGEISDTGGVLTFYVPAIIDDGP